MQEHIDNIIKSILILILINFLKLKETLIRTNVNKTAAAFFFKRSTFLTKQTVIKLRVS